MVTNIQHHFSKIAEKYRDLRTTDVEPILYIQKKLQELPKIEAADIGCGGGRYDLELFRHLGDRLDLHCIDANPDMLKELHLYLTEQGIKNFRTAEAPAEKLPLESNSLDCVFTFNAIHHFKLADFFAETCRILKDNGLLFAYTRSRTQNNQNIWGKYFPLFKEKEIRIYELYDFQEVITNNPQLELHSVEEFQYERVANLDELIEQAQNHHYSTFYLYTEEEFEKSLKQFKKNVQMHFPDSENIQWIDGNTLLVIRKLKN
ncbi:MAG: class I SAM-dependent methyltransferase [Xenococcaceae cyanobacterium]